MLYGTGIGGGGAVLASTVYIVEIAEPQIRGALNTLMQVQTIHVICT